MDGVPVAKGHLAEVEGGEAAGLDLRSAVDDLGGSRGIATTDGDPIERDGGDGEKIDGRLLQMRRRMTRVGDGMVREAEHLTGPEPTRRQGEGDIGGDREGGVDETGGGSRGGGEQLTGWRAVGQGRRGAAGGMDSFAEQTEVGVDLGDDQLGMEGRSRTGAADGHGLRRSRQGWMSRLVVDGIVKSGLTIARVAKSQGRKRDKWELNIGRGEQSGETGKRPFLDR